MRKPLQISAEQCPLIHLFHLIVYLFRTQTGVQNPNAVVLLCYRMIY